MLMEAGGVEECGLWLDLIHPPPSELANDRSDDPSGCLPITSFSLGVLSH
jgi:hypothetical protein